VEQHFVFWNLIGSGAVERVSDNRQTRVGQMDPDLMGAAAVQGQ
jgi:hypothetical protein